MIERSAGEHPAFRPWRFRSSARLEARRRELFALAAPGWGVLNLVIGGIVSVLPLSILPFVPEQSVTHYAAHVVYAVGQVPLVLVSYRAVRLAATTQTRHG